MSSSRPRRVRPHGRMDGISIDTWLMVIVLIAASSGSCCLVVLRRPDVERPFDRTPVRSCTPSGRRKSTTSSNRCLKHPCEIATVAAWTSSRTPRCGHDGNGPPGVGQNPTAGGSGGATGHDQWQQGGGDPRRAARRERASPRASAGCSTRSGHSVERRGYPPSMREIGEAVGLTSSSSVSHQLATLERKGFLRRDPNRPRAIEVRHPDGRRPAGARRRTAVAATCTTSRPAAATPGRPPPTSRSSAGSPPAGRSWPSRSVEDVFPLPRQVVGEGTLFLLQVAGRLDGRRRDLRRRLGGRAPAAGGRQRRHRGRDDRRRGHREDVQAHATATSG